jgi:hypothetical protein
MVPFIEDSGIIPITKTSSFILNLLRLKFMFNLKVKVKNVC